MSYSGNVPGGLSGLGPVGWTNPTANGGNNSGIVGTETPEWFFNTKSGTSGDLPEIVQRYFFRKDAGPSGMNAAEQPTPQAIDALRQAINAGLVRPVNQGATNIARSYGGLQAGDQTLLGPLIDGMPEGLTPEYWGIVIQRAQQAANEQIAIMNATGYFNNMPTLERQRVEADIANNIARTSIEKSLADNTIRSTDLDEAYRRDAMAQDMRQNIISQFGYDPGPQGAAGAAAGNQNASVMMADGTLPMPGSAEQKAQLQMYQASQGGQNLGGTVQSGAAVQAAQSGAPGAAAAAAPGGADMAAQTPPPGMPGGPPVTPGAGQYGQVGANGARPNMTTQVGSEIGRQWVDGQGWVQTLGGRAADLSQQQQAFAQQQAQAALASNPRNYIEAQMLGNARGGMAGMAPNNQVDPTTGMPGQFPGGMQWPAQPGQPPQMGQQPAPWGMPGQFPGGAREPMMGIEPWQQPGVRQPQMGADGEPMMGIEPWQQPGGSQWQPRTPLPGADGQPTMGIEPWQMGDQAARYKQAMIEAQQAGQTGMPGAPTDGTMPGVTGKPTPTPYAGPQQPGMNYALGAQPQAMASQWTAMANQAQQGGQEQMKAAQLAGFQAPGNAGMGATAMQQPSWAGQAGMGANGMGQASAPGQQKFAVGAFSQALNQNRLVPKSGAMNTQGAYQTMGQIGQATNPQKWRAQDFMRGNASEKEQALGTASAAGFSDEDTQSMLGKSLPTFRAPGAGAMV